MKSSSSSALWTVAMAATAMAIPILLKRASPETLFDCFLTAQATGKWDCQAMNKVEIGLITGVTIKPLTIELKPPGGAEFSLSSSNMQANVLTPSFLINGWPLTHSKERAALVYKGIDMATLETTMAPTTVAGSKVTTILAPTDLSINPGAGPSFSDFIGALLGQAEVEFFLKGTLDAILKIKTVVFPTMIDLNIPGLSFNSPITLKGCNGFPGIKFTKLISFVQDATSKNFILTADVTLINPSDLVVKLGELKFQTKDDKGNVVGTAVFTDFKLEQGPNTLRVTVTSNVAKPDQLINVLTTEGDVFHFSGYEGSSASKILADGLSKFTTQVTIPILHLTPAA